MSPKQLLLREPHLHLSKHRDDHFAANCRDHPVRQSGTPTSSTRVGCTTIFASRACMRSQLTPLSDPASRFLHSIGSFSSGGKSVYHLGNTQSRAISRNPRSPFSSLATRFLRNTRRRTFNASGAQHSLEPLVERVRDLVCCLRRQALQHLHHQAVGGPVGLVLHHFHPCAKNPVDSDSYMRPSRATKPSRQLL